MPEVSGRLSSLAFSYGSSHLRSQVERWVSVGVCLSHLQVLMTSISLAPLVGASLENADHGSWVSLIEDSRAVIVADPVEDVVGKFGQVLALSLELFDLVSPLAVLFLVFVQLCWVG